MSASGTVRTCSPSWICANPRKATCGPGLLQRLVRRAFAPSAIARRPLRGERNPLVPPVAIHGDQLRGHRVEPAGAIPEFGDGRVGNESEADAEAVPVLG